MSRYGAILSEDERGIRYNYDAPRPEELGRHRVRGMLLTDKEVGALSEPHKATITNKYGGRLLLLYPLNRPWDQIPISAKEAPPDLSAEDIVRWLLDGVNQLP